MHSHALYTLQHQLARPLYFTTSTRTPSILHNMHALYLHNMHKKIQRVLSKFKMLCIIASTIDVLPVHVAVFLHGH